MNLVLFGLVLGGCMFGGGPTVGYGLRTGAFAGAEATTGVANVFPLEPGQQAQLSVGIQTPRTLVYAHAVAAYDAAGASVEEYTKWATGGRAGGGFGIDDSRRIHGMFLVGGNYGRVLDLASCVPTSPEFHGRSIVLVAWLDVRYLREWQVALTTRLEVQPIFCRSH